MTEIDLRCNVVTCRRPLGLEGKACVTTCSHIFCMDCSNISFTKALVCPACGTGLTETDDIVLTELSPTEEYKSSVLAGIRPDHIMEITARAISFYIYQVSQEILFQEMMCKNIEEKTTQFQSAIRDANGEIGALKERIALLAKEAEVERHKNLYLVDQLQEKNRQFQKLQVMYEKLKRKNLVPIIQQNFQQQQLQGPAVKAAPQQQPFSTAPLAGTRTTHMHPITHQQQENAGVQRRSFSANMIGQSRGLNAGDDRYGFQQHHSQIRRSPTMNDSFTLHPRTASGQMRVSNANIPQRGNGLFAIFASPTLRTNGFNRPTMNQTYSGTHSSSGLSTPH